MRTLAILSALFGGFRRKGRARSGGIFAILIGAVFLACVTLTSGCTTHTIGNAELSRNVYVELVDWHVSGLWIFNTPICWIRVVNYNDVPVKDVRVRFKTFGYNGELLSNGTYTMEGSVGPRSVKNFVEQTVGLVDLESDMLSIELDAVESEH
ncbi:hypothetical protein KF728_23695 [Candidatus Obscuribacterales bacterium]|nr:hypothetical protein [Candidatus Obscuribacterales bacterium]